MGVVQVKSNVQFQTIAPAGFRILSAIDQCAAKLDCDLVITSGTDGLHSGPLDPHHTGEAYDVRSHDFSQEQKDLILAQINTMLGDRFYGFLEAPGQDNEHFHWQRAKNTVYP